MDPREYRVGDIRTVRSVQAAMVDEHGNSLQVTYTAPEGEYFVIALLGVTHEGDVFDVDEAIKQMGWVKRDGVDETFRDMHLEGKERGERPK